MWVQIYGYVFVIIDEARGKTAESNNYGIEIENKV